MGFLHNIFGKKEEPIRSYEDFWNWFVKDEKELFSVVKGRGDVEEAFSKKFFPKLNALNNGFFYLVGMFDDNTAELVLTADGNIKNVVFIEELVDAAPKVNGWMFTKLKPALDIDDVSINMNGYSFNKNNISFYSNDDLARPDSIEITVVYSDFEDENRISITNGVYLFLDNIIGELNFAKTIDNLLVIGKESAQKELIQIEKLKDFLNWREKEFIEKYEGTRHNTDDDAYSILEAKLENGNPLIAVINTQLLRWDSKASHPWILNVEIKYCSEKFNNGMPDQQKMKLLEDIENEALDQLKDFDGYLNIGRQTANGTRDIFFACKDFRKPSKVIHDLTSKYKGKVDIGYDIYKDKYWRSFDRFVPKI